MPDRIIPVHVSGSCKTAHMYAIELLRELMQHLDARRWGALEGYLHPSFLCTYVHTGETMGRDAWVKLNAEYPGFDRLIVQEITGGEMSAACRAHVTGVNGAGTLDHFECATFVSLKDGQIHRMTEVWTDVDQRAPEGTRPV